MSKSALKNLVLTLKEPIVWMNLLLRLCLLGFVLYSTHWNSGDSGYYLDNAVKIASGTWGGDNARPVFYSWFIYFFSLVGAPISNPATASSLWLSLLIQTLLVWSCGIYLYLKFNKQIKAPKLLIFFWLFDPVLFVFSAMLMSDALFAVELFVIAVIFRDFVLNVNINSKQIIFLGVMVGLALLTRAIALPILGLTLVMALIYYFSKKEWRKTAHIGLILGVATLTVSPLLYWNLKVNRKLAIVTQDGGWLHTVAAAVEYHDQGLDYYQAETKWFKEGRNNEPGIIFKTLKNKFSTWIKLTSKGVARVFFGHINVEIGSLILGQAPIGPGWFKVPEQRAGPRVEGGFLVLWILGLILTFGVCAYVYFSILKEAYLASVFSIVRCFDFFTVWSITVILALAIVPQVWGDARFRAPLWGLVILLWAHISQKNYMKNNKNNASSLIK